MQVNEHIMIHEIGLLLGIVGWIKDYQAFGASSYEPIHTGTDANVWHKQGTNQNVSTDDGMRCQNREKTALNVPVNTTIAIVNNFAIGPAAMAFLDLQNYIVGAWNYMKKYIEASSTQEYLHSDLEDKVKFDGWGNVMTNEYMITRDDPEAEGYVRTHGDVIMTANHKAQRDKKGSKGSEKKGEKKKVDAWA
ncbi:uncharacterized protein LOC120270029 [Dioscorea cayenensis subsp. rotundata]|uniref:Uncharacterized protein LOC120270029 n=1 Tax=Dioscorea cayennensis subsp. rotundata TaxID=55577 RepID=A0AB40C0W9_DIOCR|nr:uncharacterized protein LOC120270029 [Dioscorea cayenensis subsp. rotundata]